MKRPLAECAQRIIDGYRAVCEMTPHVECKPEEASDGSVRLAVYFQSSIAERDIMRDLLRRSYLAMHRAQWQDGETDSELCSAINDAMDDEWRDSVDASRNSP